MSTRNKWLLTLAILGVICVSAFWTAQAYWKERNRILYREAEVSRGKIVAVVNVTGTIKPVRSVQVGTFVSGPIEAIHVDFNSEIKAGDLMAQIDPRLYKANLARDEANLAMQEASVKQVKAKLQQAINDEARSILLRKQNPAFISDSEMDQYKFGKLSLEAQLSVAEANVLQAKANRDTSKANLDYTQILAPVSGVVIDRKIDEGQTVAATFQTPDLFIVAPDLRKEVHVYASVDETDIGQVHNSKAAGMPVRFTVDAYPDDLFVGKIYQIRKNSTTTQNVVTYPVIVSAPNEHLKLLPGMTASISFQIGEKTDRLRIPNAALRFFPNRDQVRNEDRKLLEGSARNQDPDEPTGTNRSADEKAESRRLRNRRYVWVRDDYFLKAVEVVIGLSDSRFTEVISGDLKEGEKLVTGIQPKN